MNELVKMKCGCLALPGRENEPCPEHSTMNVQDAATKEKRIEASRRLINRSARLLRLVELDAPGYIVETERQLVAESLEMFPFDNALRIEVAAQRVRSKK